MTITLEHPDDERFHIENVEPLIVLVELREGGLLEFCFRCPVSDFAIVTQIRPGYDEGESAGASFSARFFEGGEAARGAADPSKISSEASAAWTVGEIEEAACDAFQLVSSDFLWDGMRWTYWEAEDRVVEFLEYSEALEALSPEGDRILARVLAAVAAADGKIKPVQRQLLLTLLGEQAPRKGSPLPTADEMLSLGSKTLAAAVVTFAYAVASVDGAISPAEAQTLDLVCRLFGLGTLKIWELKRIAASFVVDEAFSRTYEVATPMPKERIEVYKLAKGLKLSHTETRQIEWRFLKRAGLA